jgi:hypothetical protein
VVGLGRLRTIRARNRARYSPDSLARTDRALNSYNWRVRGPLIAAVIVEWISLTLLHSTPIRIAGSVMCVALLAMSGCYQVKHRREVNRAVGALRASRQQHEGEVGSGGRLPGL